MSGEEDVILAQQGHKEAFVRLIKANEETMYRCQINTTLRGNCR